MTNENMENKCCPICKSTGFKVLGRSKTNSISASIIKKDYKVVQCNVCCSYYVMPLIEFSNDQRAKELKQRLNKAEKYLKNNTIINFLDIGAGEGNTLIAGIERGWEVTGIDIVDNRIERAKINKIRFIKTNFLEHEFPENYFDFIYLDSVLEHVLNPIEYLIKIKNILKIGGILYIGVPNEDSLFNDVRAMVFKLIGRKGISVKIQPFSSPYHVIGFNLYSLNFLIKKIDMEIKIFRNFGRKFDFLSTPPNNKGFWISLFFLFPIEVLGYFTKRDVYFEVYLSKK
jgi:SAM-dependent methyltransferase